MHLLVLDHHRKDAGIAAHHVRPRPVGDRADGVQDRGPHSVSIGEHLLQ